MPVKSSGGESLAIGRERHRVDARRMSAAGRRLRTGLRVVEIDVRARARDGDLLAVGRPVEREDGAILRFELAQQRGLLADLEVPRAVHHIDVRDAVLAADDDDVLLRMPCDGREFASQLIDVLQHLSLFGVDELGGPIAAHRDEALRIDAEYGGEHPVLVTADLVKLAAACGIEDVDGIVRAPDGHFLRVGREGGAEDGVAADLDRFQ